jgi:hypothetical protein
MANRLQNGSTLAEDDTGRYTEYCTERDLFRQVNGEMFHRMSSRVL